MPTIGRLGDRSADFYYALRRDYDSEYDDVRGPQFTQTFAIIPTALLYLSLLLEGVRRLR